MEGLEIQRQGAALVATVERGDQNSFTSEMIDALADAIDEATGDGATRFVHIRARGPVFCVARDRAGTTPEELRAEAGRIVRINETCGPPLISIRGAGTRPDSAAGSSRLRHRGGLREAGSGSGIAIGLAPTVVISWASKLLPTKRAFDMVVTGQPIGAATAAHPLADHQTVPASGCALLSRTDRGHRVDAASVRGQAVLRARSYMDAPSAAQASIAPLVLGSLRLQGR
jgi:enoyl-CoA hydratase/carnithine racemase